MKFLNNQAYFIMRQLFSMHAQTLAQKGGRKRKRRKE